MPGDEIFFAAALVRDSQRVAVHADFLNARENGQYKASEFGKFVTDQYGQSVPTTAHCGRSLIKAFAGGVKASTLRLLAGGFCRRCGIDLAFSGHIAAAAAPKLPEHVPGRPIFAWACTAADPAFWRRGSLSARRPGTLHPLGDRGQCRSVPSPVWRSSSRPPSRDGRSTLLPSLIACCDPSSADPTRPRIVAVTTSGEGRI